MEIENEKCMEKIGMGSVKGNRKILKMAMPCPFANLRFMLCFFQCFMKPLSHPSAVVGGSVVGVAVVGSAVGGFRRGGFCGGG